MIMKTTRFLKNHTVRMLAILAGVWRTVVQMCGETYVIHRGTKFVVAGSRPNPKIFLSRETLSKSKRFYQDFRATFLFLNQLL